MLGIQFSLHYNTLTAHNENYGWRFATIENYKFKCIEIEIYASKCDIGIKQSTYKKRLALKAPHVYVNAFTNDSPIRLS